MIDLSSGKTIDLIQSRKLEDIINWLKLFPNIKVISRDGSNIYKSAISESLPNALQVSDRFHILKNLSDYAKKELYKLIPHLTTIKVVKSSPNQRYIELKEKINNKTIYSESYVQKLKLIDQVKKAYKNNPNIRKLSRDFKLSRRTINQYISGQTPLYERKRASILDKYKKSILKLIEAKNSIVNIQKFLIKEGVNTTYSNTKYYVNKIKVELEFFQTNENIVTFDIINIYRNKLTNLLYNKSITDLKLNNDEIFQLKLMIKNNKQLKLLLSLVTDFRIILFSKDTKKLDVWMESVDNSSFKNLKSFVGGLRKDIDAVYNSITTTISNGKIEGKINKLKKLKRDMYGRASFELLKNKFFLINNQLN